MLLNVLVPDWLQTALLTLLLLFVINKTVRKGITQWRQEQKAIQQKRALAEVTPPTYPCCSLQCASQLSLNLGQSTAACFDVLPCKGACIREVCPCWLMRDYVRLQDHVDNEDDEDGVLHEERFERNPSKKFDALQHHSSVQEFGHTLSHIWHRLPFTKANQIL